MPKQKFFYRYLPIVLSVVLLAGAGFWYLVFVTKAGGGTNGNGTHGNYVQQGGKFRQRGGKVVVGGATVGPVAQTGTNTEFNVSTANSGTASTTIAVPSDATMIIVGISGFHSVINYFSGGSMTFTKGGVDSAMTAVQPATRGDGYRYLFSWYLVGFFVKLYSINS